MRSAEFCVHDHISTHFLVYFHPYLLRSWLFAGSLLIASKLFFWGLYLNLGTFSPARVLCYDGIWLVEWGRNWPRTDYPTSSFPSDVSTVILLTSHSRISSLESLSLLTTIEDYKIDFQPRVSSMLLLEVPSFVAHRRRKNESRSISRLRDSAISPPVNFHISWPLHYRFPRNNVHCDSPDQLLLLNLVALQLFRTQWLLIQSIHPLPPSEQYSKGYCLTVTAQSL